MTVKVMFPQQNRLPNLCLPRSSFCYPIATRCASGSGFPCKNNMRMYRIRFCHSFGNLSPFAIRASHHQNQQLFGSPMLLKLKHKPPPCYCLPSLTSFLMSESIPQADRVLPKPSATATTKGDQIHAKTEVLPHSENPGI